ncbi:MAG: flavodoxin domain-containing protein [Treponema sp.]|nr:flavodoxin domain-containing protein [Treponema sp.]
MKILVIYSSQTGFTKKYAEWISQESGADCLDFKQAKKMKAEKLSQYDSIVYGCWVMANSFKNLSWFQKKVSALAGAGKKLFVYTVGGSPADSPEILNAMKKNFSSQEWQGVQTFYFPGGLNYEKMKGFPKFILTSFVKAFSKKKNATEEEQKLAQMLSHSFDISDKEYIKPLLESLK